MRQFRDVVEGSRTRGQLERREDIVIGGCATQLSGRCIKAERSAVQGSTQPVHRSELDMEEGK
jgi:hypothetical protein